jgi:hypothetical protein
VRCALVIPPQQSHFQDVNGLRQPGGTVRFP